MEKEQTRLAPLGPHEYLVTVGDTQLRVQLMEPGKALINGRTVTFDLSTTSEGVSSLLLDGTVFDVAVLGTPGIGVSGSDGTATAMKVSVNGTGFELTVDDRRSQMISMLLKSTRHAPKSVVVTAPMPGMIVRLEVEQGTTVEAGAGLLVLEAMKMENEIWAINHGRIDEICVQRGQKVEKGEPLIRMTLQ